MRRFELIEEPSFLLRETSFISPKTLAFPSPFSHPLTFDPFPLPSPFHFDQYDDVLVSHLILTHHRPVGPEVLLQSLSDRVAELESRFDRLVRPSRYTWTAEIKGREEEEGFHRKYKWVAEIVEEAKRKEEEKTKKNKKKIHTCGAAKNVKWTAEIKGNGESSRKYTFEIECGENEKVKEKEKKQKKKGEKDHKSKNELRVVEIEEPNDEGAVILRQAFAKRFGAIQNQRGKRKDLSAQDAALLIQLSFRAYLIRRSKALRALRELAVAKSKLKEVRAQFNNFAYRRRLSRDAEERQKFSEKIIVLLLTVDAIEGVDMMVRSAKRSMVDELEAMLDVVDPQPAAGRSLSKRRTFDMPDGVIRKEIEEGVAQVVRMIDEADRSSGTFEACL